MLITYINSDKTSRVEMQKNDNRMPLNVALATFVIAIVNGFPVNRKSSRYLRLFNCPFFRLKV